MSHVTLGITTSPRLSDQCSLPWAMSVRQTCTWKSNGKGVADEFHAVARSASRSGTYSGICPVCDHEFYVDLPTGGFITVGELIKVLTEQDPTDRVVIGTDDEYYHIGEINTPGEEGYCAVTLNAERPVSTTEW